MPKLAALAAASMIAITVSALAQTPAAPAVSTPASPASAAEQVYDLPAAPMADTLAAIARQSSKSVQFDPAAVANLRSSPVIGRQTALTAVTTALSGQKLAVSVAADGSLIVVAVADVQRVLVLAKRDQAEVSFKADHTDTSNRADTSVMDTPSAVTILTSKLLESQQSTSVYDALANVSGLNFTQSPQGTTAFVIRGFATSSVTSNGVSGPNAANTNVFGVERIEVLKGPQAILAGGSSLGGGVNVITKKPQTDPIKHITLEAGTYADLGVAGDFSNALTEDKKVSYRLILAADHADNSQGHYDGRHDYMAMPEIRFKDATTDVTVGLYAQDQHSPVPAYTFANAQGVIQPKPTIALGDKGDGFNLRTDRVFYDLTQQIFPDLFFVSRFNHESDFFGQHLYTPLQYQASGNVFFTTGQQRAFSTTTASDNFLKYNVATGPLDHKLAVGFNFSNYEQTAKAYQATPYFSSKQIYPPLDGQFPNTDSLVSPLNSDISGTKQRSFYLQDLVSWNALTVSAALRHDKFTYTADRLVSLATPPDPTSVYPGSNLSRNSPSLGAVYGFADWVSGYASFSKGFVGQNTTVCGGGIADPLITTNREFGAKFDLLNSRLLITASAFRLNEVNALVYDPVNGCSVETPAQLSKGIELDVQGEVTKGFNTVFNFSHSSNQDPSDSTAVYPGRPANKASFWGTYEFQGESLRGFGVGLGVTAASRYRANYSAAAPFYIPAQEQFDGSIFYRRSAWSVNFGVKNLTNKTLYGTSTNNAFVPILTDRAYRLTVGFDL